MIIGRPRARTPEYCAPEMQKGHTRGRSADAFSLGAVFFEMLTVCFYHEEFEEFKNRLQTKNRRSYTENVPGVFEWLDSRKMLQEEHAASTPDEGIL